MGVGAAVGAAVGGGVGGVGDAVGAVVGDAVTPSGSLTYIVDDVIPARGSKTWLHV